MPEILRIARGAGIAAAIAAYAVLMHHVIATGRPSILGAFLAMAPVLLIGLAMLSNARLRVSGVVLLGLGGTVFWITWPKIAQHAGLLFWFQDMALLLTLLATFGRTLIGERIPLCVTFAAMVHGPLSPVHERYARQVTVAWVIFFSVLAVISTSLFFLAPLTVWSVYANFMVLPLVALMFVAEYLVRRRLLSDTSHGHILDAVNAYLKSSRPHG